jgi:hypothetical protein
LAAEAEAQARTLLIEKLKWLVGFACGYGVREYIARRRHAADREKFYQEHPELHRLRGL